MQKVRESGADLGIVVDPDVDRLVLIMENGEPFNEEYTIAQAVKFVLSKEKGNVVVNLSTTRAVEDIANEFNCKVYRSPVGEANVVAKMKQVNAVIGGEGSGGVIYPAVHYGRDALVGTAIVLQHLLEFGGKLSELKASMPNYLISKRKIKLQENKSPDAVIEAMKEKYSSEKINTDDGLRIDFDDHWVHLRKSNTEPIIRIYTEASSQAKADELSLKYMLEIEELMKKL
jgi:phosphomannomutase